MGKAPMKRYNTRDAAKATGLSESVFTSYASANGKSSKEGWTILEIVEVYESPRRHRKVRPANESAVAEIKAALVSFGITTPTDNVSFDEITPEGTEAIGA